LQELPLKNMVKKLDKIISGIESLVNSTRIRRKASSPLPRLLKRPRGL
jgi:hypothetical protein